MSGAWGQAPAGALAQAYSERWEHETGNKQLKTYLRGPGKVLRSQSPDMVRQEIYGFLLTHYAISALICKAATEAQIDPDRVKFKRTVRILRRGSRTQFLPLSSTSALWLGSWPASPAARTLTPSAGTAATRASSNAAGTIPTG